MVLENKETLVGKIPLEHLVMYETHPRLKLFYHKGTACVCCGKAATTMAVVQRTDQVRRITLFTDDWVELTVDHIIPRDSGGTDTLSNYQPMCQLCNRIKSNRHLSVEQLRQFIKATFKGI